MLDSLRTPLTALTALVLGGVVAACGAAPPDAPDGDNAASVAEAQTVVNCNAQVACCVGSPTTFNLSDPLQAQLKAWGCTAPKLYSPDHATGAWWYWTFCKDPSQTVENYLKAHPADTAAPDYAQTTSSLTAGCATPPPAGFIDVLYDPTCATCRLR